MGYFFSEDASSKIMLLKLRKRRIKLLSGINCDLLQKGSANAHENARIIKGQVRESLKNTGWDFVPRAGLALTLSFHANSPGVAYLPKLVKYLLDELLGEVCSDDKQFRYIAASCYRSHDSNGGEDSVFVEVERLLDFNQKLGLFTKLLRDDDLRRYLKDSGHSSYLTDSDDNRIEKYWPDEETARHLNLPSETVRQWHRMIRNQNQQNLLSMNRLDEYDRPEGRKHCLHEILGKWSESNPFIFHMEGIPTGGGVGKYKLRLRAKLKELSDKFPAFGKIISPLELDIQVSLKRGARKDLDNIMQAIAVVFNEELLELGSYLHGYRIYEVKEHNPPSVDSLRFKLLPLFAISDFQDYVDDVLKMGAGWLEERIRWGI